MLIPDPRRTPLPNLISHNGVILYQWEFLRARLDEGEGLPWIAMDIRILYIGVSMVFERIRIFRFDAVRWICRGGGE